LKRLVLFLFLGAYGLLYATDIKSTLKVYNKLFSILVPKKQTVHVYVDDPVYRDIFSRTDNIAFATDFGDADLVLVTDPDILRQYRSWKKTHPLSSAVLFATKYSLLEANKDVVGALYWRKGRPQLLFLLPRLKAHHIRLPDEFSNYAVTSL